MIISKENFNKIIDKNITRFLIIEKSISSNLVFFFSSRRRHTRLVSDWSSDVCSSDLRFRTGSSRLPLATENGSRKVPQNTAGSLAPAGVNVPEILPRGRFERSTAPLKPPFMITNSGERSEERRVGKESRSRGA